jgi:hypothetical protein
MKNNLIKLAKFFGCWLGGTIALVCLAAIDNSIISAGTVVAYFLASPFFIFSFWLYQKEDKKWKDAGVFVMAITVALALFSLITINKAAGYNSSYYSKTSPAPYEFSYSEKAMIKFNNEQIAKYTKENQQYQKYGTSHDVNFSYRMAVNYEYDNCKIFEKDPKKIKYDSYDCTTTEKDYFSRNK